MVYARRPNIWSAPFSSRIEQTLNGQAAFQASGTRKLEYLRGSERRGGESKFAAMGSGAPTPVEWFS